MNKNLIIIILIIINIGLGFIWHLNKNEKLNQQESYARERYAIQADSHSDFEPHSYIDVVEEVHDHEHSPVGLGEIGETSLDSIDGALIAPIPVSSGGIPGVFLLTPRDFIEPDWESFIQSVEVDGLLSLEDWRVEGNLPAEVLAASEFDCIKSQPDQCFTYVRITSFIEELGDYPVTVTASYFGQPLYQDFLLRVTE